MNDKVLKYIDTLSHYYNTDIKFHDTRYKIYYLVKGFMDALNLDHTDMIYISSKLVDFLNYYRRTSHV